MTQTTPTPFCNVLAREKGLDLVGYAGAGDIFVTLELPLPWSYSLWESDGMPEEIRRLIAVWYGDTGTLRPRLRPLAIAPDPAHARPGFRRVMVHRRPEGPFADFAKDEYSLPEADLGPFVWALLMAPDDLPAFETYREPPRNTRDFLVCTHGAVDAACAKFGFPLYRELCGYRGEQSGAEVRVWRVTHFGGHVFAPTLLELPSGRCWAFMEGGRPAQLVARRGDVNDLYGHYRVWSGLDSSFLQAAEREVWRREGWGWLGFKKRGLTLEQDDAEDPTWAQVRLEFRRPDGTTGAYEARVELAESVETRHSTSEAEPYRYPQYRVTQLNSSR